MISPLRSIRRIGIVRTPRTTAGLDMRADRSARAIRTSKARYFSVLVALLALVLPLSGKAAAAQPIPPPALAQDGRGLFGESFATRAMFTAVWGDRAGAEWIQEHDAALSGGTPVTGPRIGFFSSASETSNPSVTEGLVAGLRAAGYRPGQDIRIEWRFSGGHNEVLPSIASELVRLPVDVIVTPSTPESLAAKQATSTIPIVTVSVGDPVGAGLVANLDRPDANLTGELLQPLDLIDQQLAVLKEVVPNAGRVAVLVNVANPANVTALSRARDAAARLGLEVLAPEVRSMDDVPGVFAAATQQDADAVLVIADALFTLNRAQILQLAAAARRPTLYPNRSFVDDGGVLDYAAKVGVGARGAAGYVAAILHGAKPQDLPMSAPNELELVVNLKAAQAIGVTIPPSVIAKATEVI
jgi:putative ABC transport system substrate-binding protein